ncbi:tagaturonate reductase [Anaerobacillus alkaliphilus]|uniref:Tagaturonate reductase n=1 Tax=Anaerobacillus alkaliphilus TaxID=1548597 RepID=A0A4Q0VUN9_9BACI|nr:tagaturonate reductase [Anaerobacillus alkaliphilus]RXJ02106.1 tagaturonate reductase [Anaerobacillus alkaliphilus]
MDTLNKTLDKRTLPASVTFETQENLPERVIQFGEGNFMRGFVDWMINELNKQGLFNGKVVLVQPRGQDKIPVINNQDGLYTVVLRGVEDGEKVEKKEIISAVSRGIKVSDDWAELNNIITSTDIKFIFSNTTEAGLTYLKEDYNPDFPAESFPGKLTSLLYHRFTFFKGSSESGLVIIPCELVEENGNLLKKIVLKIAEDWELPSAFINWIKSHNKFCNTLVDRIVTGFPSDEINEFEQKLGYKDELLTVGEPYHLFAIEATPEVAKEIPFDQAGLNVKWGDITPFRNLKVRLLNGPHTMMSAVCYLAGVDTVQEVMEDVTLRKFIENGMLNEIYPTVDIDEVEKKQFLEAVIERFLNPYNKHYLKDIALSSVFKFKSRLVPSLLDYVEQKGTLPPAITFALAGLLAFNRPVRVEANELVGQRGEVEYSIRDNHEVMQILLSVWTKFDGTSEELTDLVSEVLSKKEIWGQDLHAVPNLTTTVATQLDEILKNGMRASVEKLVNQASTI